MITANDRQPDFLFVFTARKVNFPALRLISLEKLTMEILLEVCLRTRKSTINFESHANPDSDRIGLGWGLRFALQCTRVLSPSSTAAMCRRQQQHAIASAIHCYRDPSTSGWSTDCECSLTDRQSRVREN